MFDGIATSIRRLAAASLLAAMPASAQELPVTREGLASALAQYVAGADRNGDGKLDRAEVAAALGYARAMLSGPRDAEPFVMGVDPDGTPRLSVNKDGPLSTAGAVDLAFRIADRDGDGMLSGAEVQAAGRAVFDAADKDHDGILDEKERAAAMEKLRLFRGILSGAK